MTSQVTSQVRGRIADNIDSAITAKGLTNRAVGEMIGRTEHQVWRWRRGKHTPSLEVLAELASVLYDGDISAFYRDRPKTRRGSCRT